MAYFRHKQTKYTTFSDLRRALEKKPSDSPAHFVKGNSTRRIAVAPESSTLNYMRGK